MTVIFFLSDNEIIRALPFGVDGKLTSIKKTNKGIQITIEENKINGD